MAEGLSHAGVLQQRLDVLWVAGGRGQGAAVLSETVGAAAGGEAGLDVSWSAALRDEDGHGHGEEDRARSEQEGRTRDDGLLQNNDGMML